MSGENNSSLTIPNIDKIFSEGREPTEEEWRIWAENFKPKKPKRRLDNKEVQYSRKKAKAALDSKLNKRKAYRNRDKKNYQSWGSKYNQKRKYLRKYNKEWNEAEKASRQIYEYKQIKTKYDSWIRNYKIELKPNLIEHAFIFKIKDEVYVYGFSKNKLQVLSPHARNIFISLVEANVIPSPKYEGYRLINGRASKKLEQFYLFTEGRAYLNTMCNIKLKVGQMATENKRLYAKKRIWTAMLKEREIFENERE